MKIRRIIILLLENWKLKVWMKIILSTAILSTSGILFFSGQMSIFLLPCILLAAFIISFLVFRSSFPGLSDVIILLNRQLPQLEYSSDLLLEENVEGLAQIQKNIAAKRLVQHYKMIRFPLNFRPLIWVAAAGFVLVLSKHVFTFDRDDPSIGNLVQQQNGGFPDQSISDSLQVDLAVSIIPPSYSGLPTVNQSSLDLYNLLQGSMVYWKAEFNHQPEAVWLEFSIGDSLTFDQQGDHWLLRKKIRARGFYTFNYTAPDGHIISSDFASLDVVRDTPPTISVEGIPQYQSFHPSENPELSFEVNLSDDYGLTAAYIIATVTKGSGESVKFREEKIAFAKPVAGKSYTTSARLSASRFEMEAGNELYFYVEGVDNRQPDPQTTRTETFFFVLEDTSEVAFSLEGDLGIDLMPEYFRSQRQIIIDSEKLLEERESISQKEFNERSNNLGFDQKALRLKYGQFIGEESESGLDIENEPEDEPTPQKPGQVDVLSEFGHDHDHENEEGQHLDKGTVNQQENAVSAMSHSHDDAEQATFFEQSVKVKLKAALTEMWDAELYLRLYQPEKSLSYQYEALKLLQAIKNQARIYVQRIGFDPPPVNEEKSRLTGDLEEVHEESFAIQKEDKVLFPKIREALKTLDGLQTLAFPVANNFKTVWEDAGDELAGLAIEEPGKYLQLLSELKSFSEQDSISDVRTVTQLRSKLLEVLPAPSQQLSGTDYPEHVLVEEFINAMISDQQ